MIKNKFLVIINKSNCLIEDKDIIRVVNKGNSVQIEYNEIVIEEGHDIIVLLKDGDLNKYEYKLLPELKKKEDSLHIGLAYHSQSGTSDQISENIKKETIEKFDKYDIKLTFHPISFSTTGTFNSELVLPFVQSIEKKNSEDHLKYFNDIIKYFNKTYLLNVILHYLHQHWKIMDDDEPVKWGNMLTNISVIFTELYGRDVERNLEGITETQSSNEQKIKAIRDLLLSEILKGD